MELYEEPEEQGGPFVGEDVLGLLAKGRGKPDYRSNVQVRSGSGLAET